MKPNRHNLFRRLLRWSFAVAALALAAIAASETAAALLSRGRVFAAVEELPAKPAALVLGTSQYLSGGSPNLYFYNRVHAAAVLWRAGKVGAIVVSGDNSRPDYNEPDAMREALVAEGVPAEVIYTDYAGFRTLDSVVRMREIFGQSAFIVVSQEFHNRRAVVLARAHGLDAAAFNAEGAGRINGIRMWLRERPARVKLFLDLAFGKKPRFSGEPIEIAL